MSRIERGGGRADGDAPRADSQEFQTALRREQPAGAADRDTGRPSTGAGATRDPIAGIGGKLAELRKAANLTQIVLAQNVGTTQPSLARFEKDASQPNLRTVVRYAGAIGVEGKVTLRPIDGAGAALTSGLEDIVSTLSEQRKQMGLTQDVVAGRMQATQPIVARLERDDASPNLRTVMRYAEAVGYDVSIDFEKPSSRN